MAAARRGATAVLLAVTVAVAPLLSGCGDRDGGGSDVSPPSVQWERAEALVASDSDTVRIRVEIAETDEQRAYGLMHRDQLAEDAGMIFLHPREQPAEAAFWMFNTRIPLDIAYIDASGRIVSIVPMQPCASPYPQWCPTYPSGAPFSAALEMNLGWFERHGFGVGDRVTLLR